MNDAAGAVIGFILVGFCFVLIIGLGPSPAVIGSVSLFGLLMSAVGLGLSKWIVIHGLAFWSSGLNLAEQLKSYKMTEGAMVLELFVRYLIGAVGFWLLYLVFVFPFVWLIRRARGSAKPNAASAADSASKA